MGNLFRFCCLFALIVLVGCNAKVQTESKTENTLFSLLPASETGITFENRLTSQKDLDVFRYRNYYNGGGVAIGDINNDGNADIFFTANMGDNHLYLNKGNWKFEDITAKAGVAGTKMWSTGVAMADVNGDGLLDIYVCNSGNISGDSRENELFINNGDLTFSEKAKEYGLADKGFTTHAAFFDYDKDGDLDVYILNNSFRPISTLGYRNLRNVRDELGGHKLLRNDDGIFHDVSELSGIYGSVIGFGLGITVGDVNNDNWPDLYISNDFYERDYLYINQHNGTFSEELERFMGHISMFSMGADIADVNNDGYPDIFSTDMLPADDNRLKRLTAFESYDTYQLRLQTGYYHQYMRNMLQLNRGDNTFQEIGQMAGVDATDWSWGALMADFNNDGNKEILVCNGINRDVTDQDYIDYMMSDENVQKAYQGEKIDFTKFVEGMTTTSLKNYLFERDTLLHFKNVSKEWGVDQSSFSNGAAYGDLDNDGDLDLVINNLNMPSFVYRNESKEKAANNSLSIRFKGPMKNVFGIGAKVRVYYDGKLNYYEHMPMRGFQSSMDYTMTIGVGNSKIVDSLVVEWPYDKSQTLKNVNANQLVILDFRDATAIRAIKQTVPKPLLAECSMPTVQHRENDYIDFNRERLLYNMLSTQGPALATGDINNDGLDDFYLGGAKGQSGMMMMQKSNGEFYRLPLALFDADSVSEDVDALFFDADNDKDLDLYVVTGGSEFPNQSGDLQDHLYINQSVNGKISFSRSAGLPEIFQVGSCVAASDIDHDGDQDLFVGTRVIAGYYGNLPDQYILVNDGKGNFSNATSVWSSSFSGLGMVTDAGWTDFDKDGWEDLVVVGEWMPVTFYRNDGKSLSKVETNLKNTEGWWNAVHITDMNNDGRPDLVLGNLGWNSRFRPSSKQPVKLFVSDFDGNGSIDPLYTYSREGRDFTYITKQDLVKQIPPMKKKFLYARDYAGKSIDEVIPADQLKKARILKFYNASTSTLINNGSFVFDMVALPVEAQVAPVYGIASGDVNGDGHMDLVLGGNYFSVKPEIGRYDASEGLVLVGDGTGKFRALTSENSGIKVPGETRQIRWLKSSPYPKILFARNSNSLRMFKITK